MKMALLQIHSPPSLSNKPYHLPSSTLPRFLGRSKFAIKALNSSESQKPISEIGDTVTSAVPGKGFGSSSASPSKEIAKPVVEKKKERSKGRRDSIVRRSPVEKPVFAAEGGGEKIKEQGRNESAFLLAWLGLGGVILIEGIVLAASGLLPEKWDSLIVKYLYPSFTPTVVLFVAGTVGYGVVKYLQNEKIKG